MKKRKEDMGRQVKVESGWAEWLRLILPVLAVVGFVLALAWRFIEPAPPRRVVIATGPAGSTYNEYAEGYAKYFARHGITLEIRQTGGATENYQLLNDPNSGVDLALVQGGTAPPAGQRENLEAVCVVSFEPLFVAYRTDTMGPNIDRMEQMIGKRLAVGSTKGGTRKLAMPLLALHGIAPGTDALTKFVDVSGQESAELLKNGAVDVSFFAVDANTPYVIELLAAPGIKLMDFKRAAAYASRFEYLSTVNVPEGAMDLKNNIPDHPTQLVAPTTALVSRKSTHKAIIQLIVQSAQIVHGRRNPLAPPGAFPTLDYTELPIGAEARYFFTTKPSFIQRKFPFWIASLIDRLAIVIVPLLVVLIPLVRLLPPVYRWRMKSRIYKWYKRLRMIESHITGKDTTDQTQLHRDEIDKLDREIADTRVPLSYMEGVYNLRTHLAWLKGRLAVGGKPAAAPAAS